MTCQSRRISHTTEWHAKTFRNPGAAIRRRAVRVACSATGLEPVLSSVLAWAPATVANLGPGFDWMGCAVQGQGDSVQARVVPGQPGTVTIEDIFGDEGRLSRKVEANCVGIAAVETLKLFPSVPDCGIALTLTKGMPLGSGMGSSAASAAAACWAVNNLFGCPVPKEKLIFAGLQSEKFVSGYHADNIAPALLGGFIMVRSADPLDIEQLPFEGNLRFVLVNPKFEAPTREMRAALPERVLFKQMISNSIAGGSLVAGILRNDIAQLGRALDSEQVVEAARGPLIPGFAAVKQAARDAGAYGCTISGAGPTVVAIVDNDKVGEVVAQAMSQAFREAGGLEINTAQVVGLDREGARLL